MDRVQSHFAGTPEQERQAAGPLRGASRPSPRDPANGPYPKAEWPLAATTARFAPFFVIRPALSIDHVEPGFPFWRRFR